MNKQLLKGETRRSLIIFEKFESLKEKRRKRQDVVTKLDARIRWKIPLKMNSFQVFLTIERTKNRDFETENMHRMSFSKIQLVVFKFHQFFKYISFLGSMIRFEFRFKE